MPEGVAEEGLGVPVRPVCARLCLFEPLKIHPAEPHVGWLDLDADEDAVASGIVPGGEDPDRVVLFDQRSRVLVRPVRESLPSRVDVLLESTVARVSVSERLLPARLFYEPVEIGPQPSYQPSCSARARARASACSEGASFEMSAIS